MVKGYDPTVNDPSKIILQYLLRWSTSPNPIPMQEAQKYTKHWLKNSQYTSQTYKKFAQFQSSPLLQPQIVLKKRCRNYFSWAHMSLIFQQFNQSDQICPAYSQDNKIILCLNHITNKTQLKQNMDRQLTVLLRKNQKIAGNPETFHQNEKLNKQIVSKLKDKQSDKNRLEQSVLSKKDLVTKHIQERDKQFYQDLYEGCRQGYRNYLFKKQVQERLSKKCAKYLFLRRCARPLPWDAKFRYATKVADESI